MEQRIIGLPEIIGLCANYSIKFLSPICKTYLIWTDWGFGANRILNAASALYIHICMFMGIPACKKDERIHKHVSAHIRV